MVGEAFKTAAFFGVANHPDAVLLSFQNAQLPGNATGAVDQFFVRHFVIADDAVVARFNHHFKAAVFFHDQGRVFGFDGTDSQGSFLNQTAVVKVDAKRLTQLQNFIVGVALRCHLASACLARNR